MKANREKESPAMDLIQQYLALAIKATQTNPYYRYGMEVRMRRIFRQMTAAQRVELNLQYFGS